MIGAVKKSYWALSAVRICPSLVKFNIQKYSCHASDQVAFLKQSVDIIIFHLPEVKLNAVMRRRHDSASSMISYLTAVTVYVTND